MEEKEIERLSQELKDVEIPTGLDLEEILREERGEGAPAESANVSPEPEGETPTDSGAGEEEVLDAAAEPSERSAELTGDGEGEHPEDGFDGFPENGFEDLPEGEEPPAARERRRMRVPEIPDEALILLAGMALSAVLASIAVAMGLEDTAWRVMMTLSLAVGCVPMAIGSLGFLKDRGRVPAPLVMLAACVVTALAGNVVEAVITAVIFNLLYAVLEAFTGHELRLVYERLEAGVEEAGEAANARLSDQLREIDGRRLRSIVLERNVDRLILLGLLAVGAVFSLLMPLVTEAGFKVWIGRGAALLAVGLYAGEAGTLMSTMNAVDSCVSGGCFFAGCNAMTAAAEITSVLFSKSGTLTDGEYRVTGVDPVRLSEEQLVFLAVYAGAWSDHPLARAVRRYAGLRPDRSRVEHHQERPGYGTLVQLDGQQIIAAGNIDLMEELGVKGDMYVPGDTCLFVAVGKTLVGRIDLEDAIRGEAPGTVNDLRRQRIANVALMTGDNALSATNVGRRVGITEVYSDCRPKDKVSRLQYILDTQEKNDRLAFVSSDRADRELLEMANIGVAMGEGWDVGPAFPDLLIPSGTLTKLPQAIAVAKAVRRNTWTSFLISAAVRFVAAVLALAGVLSLWSTVTVILLTEAGLFFNTRVPDER